MYIRQHSAGAATWWWWWWCEIFFAGRVSPSKKGLGYSYTRLLYTRRFIRINGIYLRHPPFLPYGRQLQYSTYKNGTAIDRTNRIRPGRSVMSLLFPILPKQPGLTAVFYLPLYLAGDIYKGPKLGP